jgi:uncharacterized protein (TIGR00288 family)
MVASNNLRIALLIDGDNAQPSLIQPILEAVSAYGRCVIQRVYGDWTASNMTGWRKVEQTRAIQLIQQSRYASGKNATDIAITIAAMDILHSGKVDAFCIVSSDSDFTPLVVRLKDEGAIVIGIGKESTPLSFVNACSAFISTDSLSGAPELPETSAPKAKTRPAAPPSQRPDPRPLLQQAYGISAKQEEWVFLGELGQSLRQINPKFKPKTYGQNGLAKLVSQCQDVFDIRLEKGKGKTSQMYVRLKK